MCYSKEFFVRKHSRHRFHLEFYLAQRVKNYMGYKRLLVKKVLQNMGSQLKLCKKGGKKNCEE
jgi:hypothetical protein